MTFSENELEIIAEALRNRITLMRTDAEKYKNNGNKVAQMDCIEESRQAEVLMERIVKQIRNK